MVSHAINVKPFIKRNKLIPYFTLITKIVYLTSSFLFKPPFGSPDSTHSTIPSRQIDFLGRNSWPTRRGPLPCLTDRKDHLLTHTNHRFWALLRLLRDLDFCIRFVILQSLFDFVNFELWLFEFLRLRTWFESCGTSFRHTRLVLQICRLYE